MKQPDTFLIYGANSCIGAELSRKVLPEVNNLILFYHEKTDKIKELFSDNKVHPFSSDIRDYKDFILKLENIFTKINTKNLGAVYLPAIRSYDHKPIVETSLEITKEIIDVNFVGAVHFLKGLIKMRTEEFKVKQEEFQNSLFSSYTTKLVLLGSNVSRTGLKNGSVYSATKAAIANLTRSVAMEIGHQNIFVNTISPGPIETNNSDYSVEYKKFRDEYFETQKNFTSLNKVASIDEVNSLICFLTSLDNTHLTGEEIFITGGAL